MTEHNAMGTRVATRPVWLTFLLLFVTGGLYRIFWVWRVNTDLVAFGRERAGVLEPERAIRANPSTSAFLTSLLLPGAGLLVLSLLHAVGTVPKEYGIEEPRPAELTTMAIAGLVLVLPALGSLLRTGRRIRAARELAGLDPATVGTGRGLVPLLLLEVLGIPASMFAMQHALNDLWARFPALLDEDLHGELAPEHLREAAIAARPALHEARLSRIADELEQPSIVPWVTIAFGTLAVVAYGWQLSQHGPFPDTRDIERIGGLREGLGGTWWRFWTANVLHGSIDHLVGNMVAWGVVGTIVERVVAHARMAVLVVAGAAGCSAGALLAHPDVVAIGASGVVFASFGIAAMLDPLARRTVGRLGWSLVALGIGLSTFAPGVSSGGHVGGVLAGFAVGALVMVAWRVPRPDPTAAMPGPAEHVRDRTAPLAPDRQLTTGERMRHLQARLDAGAITQLEHDRLRHALASRG